MTKTERNRVAALVHATEYLFHENLALKLVLENREVRNWRGLLDKLIADEEILAGVHLRFSDIYKEIEHSEDPCEALEHLVGELPCKKPN
jgi:sporulation-control protein spo0M